MKTLFTKGRTHERNTQNTYTLPHNSPPFESATLQQACVSRHVTSNRARHNEHRRTADIKTNDTTLRARNIFTTLDARPLQVTVLCCYFVVQQWKINKYLQVIDCLAYLFTGGKQFGPINISTNNKTKENVHECSGIQQVHTQWCSKPKSKRFKMEHFQLKLN